MICITLDSVQCLHKSIFKYEEVYYHFLHEWVECFPTNKTSADTDV